MAHATRTVPPASCINLVYLVHFAHRVRNTLSHNFTWNQERGRSCRNERRPETMKKWNRLQSVPVILRRAEMTASATTSHNLEFAAGTAPATALDRGGVKSIDDYLDLGEIEIYERIQEAKRRLGDRVVILGHHYQRDDVICHADLTGDSFKLSQQAAPRHGADYIVFCGVHFMAESADILSAGHQQVILPDLAAGCS